MLSSYVFMGLSVLSSASGRDADAGVCLGRNSLMLCSTIYPSFTARNTTHGKIQGAREILIIPVGKAN